jgi:leader peptidase (prepilin peptidase)/N-methyltransferase
VLDSTLGPLTAAWCAALGAAVGSFLNVVIARLPAGESLVWPGSRCPTCRAPIRWYDNLPLLSWLALRAHCRACGARISARYPLVESLGAAAALLAFTRHGLSFPALSEFALAACLIALAFIDLDTWLLPHAITWPLLAVGLVANSLGVGPARALWPALYGAGLGFAGFGLLAFVGEKVFRREAMGLGDVFLLGALGAWLGYRALLPVVLLASVQGAVVGLVLIAFGRGEPGPEEASPEEPSRGESPGDDPGRPAEASPAASEAAGGIEAPVSEGPSQLTERQRVDEEWVPPRHAVPFGPFLAAAALEWLYLGELLVRTVPVLGVFR